MTAKQRKALRSAAAKKGWESRRQRARMEAASNPEPNPWPRLAAMVRGWWLRATGWLR